MRVSRYELAQDPKRLVAERQIADIGMLEDMLAARNLQLIGLAGGSLRDRMSFCGADRKRYYFYVDRWDADADAAISAGFRVAVHVHAHMPIRSLTQAFALLKKHPSLQWIPDTGHLTVLEEDLTLALSQPRGRIASIHLKDWTPIYGRSAHRYIRGFTDLGRGIVNPAKILAQLRAMGFDGWIVVEQTTQLTAFEAIRRRRGSSESTGSRWAGPHLLKCTSCRTSGRRR